MSATNPRADSLFHGGPPLKLEHRLRLLKPEDPRVVRRALIVALVSWVPLLLLTIIQEQLYHNGSLWELLRDFGAYGRFVFAAPIFTLAEASCLPLLGRITQNFLDSGIVRKQDRERFDAVVQSTQRLLDSTLAEVLTVILAYAAVASLAASIRIANLPPWSVHPGSHGSAFSPAAEWQLWVSMPLLFILLFGWIWRLFAWSREMWQISRFNLQLNAAHPDHSGGLRFLDVALWGYCPLALACATIMAGALANQLRQGAVLYDFRFFVGGLVVFILAIFVAPFFVFVPKLRALRIGGMLKYGTLSCEVGQEFEKKWMLPGPKLVALEAPDFSATTDLYSIAANVYEIRYLPLGSRAVIELIVFTLIPFIPVMLLTVPLEVLLAGLKEVLF